MSERVYRVEFTSAARKQLARLDRSAQVRVLKATSLLAVHPRGPTARRMTSTTELWRIRIGDYRVVYEINEDQIVVTVVKVGHKGSVYRGLGKL